MSDFKWHGEDADESMVIRPVRAVAVYSNPAGDVVIRQEGYMGEDDDIVIVPRQHIDALVQAIMAEMDEK